MKRPIFSEDDVKSIAYCGSLNNEDLRVIAVNTKLLIFSLVTSCTLYLTSYPTALNLSLNSHKEFKMLEEVEEWPQHLEGKGAEK